MRDSDYFNLALDLSKKAATLGRNAGIMALLDIMPDHMHVTAEELLKADACNYNDFSESIEAIEEDAPL